MSRITPQGIDTGEFLATDDVPRRTSARMLRRSDRAFAEGEADRQTPAAARPRDGEAAAAATAAAPVAAEGLVTLRAGMLAALAFAALTVLVLSLWRADGHAESLPVRSGLALAGGLVAAAVAALAVFVAIRRQGRQIAATADHLAALEALHGVSAAVSGRLGDGSGREPLAQLCAATRSLFKMDRSGILVLDPAHHRLELLASAGDMPPDAPQFYDLTTLPACSGVLAGRDVLFIEDTQAELAATPTTSGAANDDDSADRQKPNARQAAAAMPVRNSQIVALFRARSLVLIPLHVEETCIGLMTLSGSSPRTFGAADRRLAQLMGAQAAVILANARLIAQTRGAAEQARAALAAHKVMLEQRDALTNVLRAGSFEESMLRIVQLAPAAVGVDRAGIGMTTDREGELVMVAVNKGDTSSIGRPHDVSAFNSGRALRERRTLVITNASVQGGVHPAFRAELPTASIVYAPIFPADGGAAAVVAPAGRPIGLLVFVRELPGEFSPEQMELMRAFCVRAGGVIETARLLDQTRQDAQTKTVLLRELNHRVKNNLAGIVALLTVARPEMTEAAERWVSRAIDRIRAMAAAHDLFTGGLPSVTLRGVVRQTVASIPLPPGVTLHEDLDGAAGVVVDTGRAVTIAMVVNELCHNAIAHGLGQAGGTVEVAAHVVDDVDAAVRRVVIDVSDDGVGYVPRSDQSVPMMPDRSLPGRPDGPGRVGVGLELVGGLVKRELRGRFSLSGRPAGGTVARVEFTVPTADAPAPAARVSSGVSATTPAAQVAAADHSSMGVG